MIGVEVTPDDVGIEAMIQIVIHPAVMVVIILDQKGSEKNILEKRAAAAEGILNIMIAEARTLLVDLVMTVRRNMLKLRGRNIKGGVEQELWFHKYRFRANLVVFGEILFPSFLRLLINIKFRCLKAR